MEDTVNGNVYSGRNVIGTCSELYINGRIIADGIQFNGSQITVTGSDNDLDIIFRGFIRYLK